MSIVTAFVVGGLVGLRHSMEADHIAAIATLVDERQTGHPGLIGTSWGIGHALPIALLGLAFVAIGVHLPEAITGWFEVVAGVVLVFLGLRMLGGLFTVHRHGDDGHAHDIRSWRPHVHFGPLAIGASHGHRYDESLLVGTVHGLAGSGALVVVLVTAAPTVGASLAFLASFTAASVTTMAAIAIIWGRAVTSRFGRFLRGAAGGVSVVVGILLIAGKLMGHGLSHAHGPGGHAHHLVDLVPALVVLL